MNKYFLPTPAEEKLIQVIQACCRNEFVLIRLTETMLDKSTIDVSKEIKDLLKKNNIANFDVIGKGEYFYKDTFVIVGNKIIERNTSFYRPKAKPNKPGDPRLCIYLLKRLIHTGCLTYFTYLEDRLVAIPLVENSFEEAIHKLFKVLIDIDTVEELRLKLKAIKEKGFIKSVSPKKFNSKDVGHTLELALGLNLNSMAKADYKGKIEIKAKIEKSGTKDSLFSCVPDWENSLTKSSAEMILKYGYVSKKHPGFQDLYVTVNHKANNQGLYLDPQNEAELLHQNFKLHDNPPLTICMWQYSTLKEKLTEKHPITVWVVAEMRKIDDEIHFWYKSLELTQNPIFSQFVSLIGLGIITYDWRGKVLPDGTEYRDHGHGFRISPKNRKLLFGETKSVTI